VSVAYKVVSIISMGWTSILFSPVSFSASWFDIFEWSCIDSYRMSIWNNSMSCRLFLTRSELWRLFCKRIWFDILRNEFTASFPVFFHPGPKFTSVALQRPPPICKTEFQVRLLTHMFNSRLYLWHRNRGYSARHALYVRWVIRNIHTFLQPRHRPGIDQTHGHFNTQ
jgi:hypothetical protein